MCVIKMTLIYACLLIIKVAEHYFSRQQDLHLAIFFIHYRWIIDRLDIKILNGGKWTFYVKEAQPEELNENGTEETNNTEDKNKI